MSTLAEQLKQVDTQVAVIAAANPQKVNGKPAVGYADPLAEIARLQAENDKLRQHRYNTSLGMKVSEKGALSVYGLGRFPVTLYREQWEKLLDMADAIRAFIVANSSVLTRKPVK